LNTFSNRLKITLLYSYNTGLNLNWKYGNLSYRQYDYRVCLFHIPDRQLGDVFGKIFSNIPYLHSHSSDKSILAMGRIASSIDNMISVGGCASAGSAEAGALVPPASVGGVPLNAEGLRKAKREQWRRQGQDHMI
jgi:hypothetical protein